MDEKILDYMTKTEYASEYPGVVKNAEHADSATGSQFADNAIKLGGNESTYYASATAVTTLGTTVNGVLTTANTAQASANRAQETADSASIDAATAKVEASTAKAIAEAAKEPAGCMKFFAGDVLPMGYFWCDGTSYPATGDYVKLYETVGTKYNLPGDLAGTFRVPDMRGRVCVGKSTETEFDSVGKIGGHKDLQEHNHTIPALTGTTAQGGSHNHFQHSVTVYDWGRSTTDPGLKLEYNNSWTFGTKPPNAITTSNNGAHSHSISTLTSQTKNEGKGDSKNLQPYLVCNYIIKY